MSGTPALAEPGRGPEPALDLEPAIDHELAEAVAGEVFAALFDPEHFRARLEATGFDAAKMDEAALRALLVERGDELRVSPSPLFDEAYYLERHPDIREGRAWGFRHFLLNGMDEGRRPHALVDPSFIAADQGVGVPEALRTWLTRESAPSETVWYGYRRWNDAPSLAQQRAVWRGLAQHCPEPALAERVLTYLPLLVEPRLAGDVGAWSLVARALNEGAFEVLPSPYWRVPLARGPDNEGSAPLVESLPPDPPRRWSPTVRLDMAFYDVRNPDLTGWTREMALHFLRHGQFEGRSGHPMFDYEWYVAHYGPPPGDPVQAHYAASARRGYAVRSNAACMAPIDHAVMAGLDVDEAIDAIAASFSDLFSISAPSARSSAPSGPSSEPPTEPRAADAAIRSQIVAASRLDPAIRPDRPGRLLMPKPFDVGHAAPLHRMSRMLAGCDVVLMRDHITLGGADRVAAAMARTLARNGHRVGVLATARTPDHDRGAARYGDASIAVIDDLIGSDDRAMRGELVYEAATLPDVRAVIAVSSAAALDVFRRFGRQIAAWAPMFVTYFCDDLDEHGNPDGYPARSFLPLVGRVEAVFTDTVHLRDELRGRVAPSVALAAKVRALPTPYAPEGEATHAPAPEPGRGRRVAWAGRFDRQKRADLLPPLAARMPDVAFDVWGKAVLDLSPFDGLDDHGLALRGTYASFAEVAATAPDAFLYTALWDGAPTILLDAVAAGIPVVASDVGGVRECLPPDYPHLVPAGEGPEAYAAALHRLFDDVAARGREAVTQGYGELIEARSEAAFERVLMNGLRRAGVTAPGASRGGRVA